MVGGNAAPKQKKKKMGWLFHVLYIIKPFLWTKYIEIFYAIDIEDI